MSCKNLDVIPENLDELINLEDIEISFCPINHIPDSILNLKKLRVIFFDIDKDNLSENSKELIKKLEINGCDIYI